MDNKRRTRMAKQILGFGQRVQYSVFECHLTQRQIADLIKKLVPILVQEEDRLRVYKIAGDPQVQVWGNVPLTVDEDFVIL